MSLLLTENEDFLNTSAKEMASELSTLRAELEECRKTIVHQDEVFAGVSRELEECKRERDEARNNLVDLDRIYCQARTALVASQAREAKLRDVLSDCKGNVNPERGYADELEADIKTALALPSDDTALRELRAADQARIEELKRVLGELNLSGASTHYHDIRAKYLSRTDNMTALKEHEARTLKEAAKLISFFEPNDRLTPFAIETYLLGLAAKKQGTDPS